MADTKVAQNEIYIMSTYSLKSDENYRINICALFFLSNNILITRTLNIRWIKENKVHN